MTDVHGDLIDVAGFRDDGRVRVRSTVARPAQDSAALVTAAWHDFDVVAGVVEMAGLDPGPAEVKAFMGGWSESWLVTIPDEPEPISFTTLLDAYVEYDPAVVAQAQAARDAAIVARDAASGYADAAASSAGDAAAAYAALTDDIENAADVIRAEVEADADTAVSAKGDAENARVGAESARTDALAAETAASGYASAASVSAGAAETARGLAVTAKDAAVTARNQAQAAASSFGLSAGTVTTGSPSSSAQVMVTGGGPAYVLNFTIPRGAQGLQGPQGTGLQLQGRVTNYSALPGGLNSTTDKGKAYIVDSDGLLYIWDGTAFPSSGNGLPLVGAKGDNGKTAYQVAVDEGFFGTAGEWLTSLIGDPGKSAYEAAVDNGFVGSESAWLDSLHGEDGADGAQDWSELTGKPSTFPPITGTGSADAKPGDWTPTWSQVSGKPSTFPPTIGSGGSQAVAGNDPRLTDARTPTAHTHDAAAITSGTLDVARVPNLAASKITSGTLDAARLPAITSAMITDGTIVDADINASAAISKTKLASGVQTSLDKADSASQLVITKVADEAAWNSGPKTAGVLYYWEG